MKLFSQISENLRRVSINSSPCSEAYSNLYSSSFSSISLSGDHRLLWVMVGFDYLLTGVAFWFEIKRTKKHKKSELKLSVHLSGIVATAGFTQSIGSSRYRCRRQQQLLNCPSGEWLLWMQGTRVWTKVNSFYLPFFCY